MNDLMMRRGFILLLVLACLLPVSSRAGNIFLYIDPLAPRDDFGLHHQAPALNTTDFAPRHPLRLPYNLTPGDALISDRAYVGALQVALYRHGYYCGPVDGVFSAGVSVAIARMQKNYSQRVTGTLTLGVRRALYLP
ncbi:MAG: peptidoglycan-binding protein [Verrucomicrobiota bacterium]|nr:peptidoglycan-binding protein [Verrucomicrobiota bacterium]